MFFLIPDKYFKTFPFRFEKVFYFYGKYRNMAKQFTPEVKQVFLKPDEAKFVALMVSQFITDHKETEHHDWNEEARKYRAEMFASATSLKSKLSKLGFNVNDMDPYKEGDEDEFLNR